MKRYKVAFACGHLSTGGMPRTVQMLLKYIDRRRFEPFLFEYSYAGINVIRDEMLLLAPHFLTPSQQLFQELVETLGIDVIHYNDWPKEDRPDLPSVEVIHNPWTADDYGPASLYLTIKRFQEKHFEEKNLPYKRVRLGVDTEEFDPSKYDREKLLKEYGFKPPVILQIGTVAPYKFQKEFLELWEKNPADATLVFAGPLAENFKFYWGDFVDKYSSDRIIFLDERKDIPQLLAVADLLVHPAVEEGGSCALFEAAAMEVPVVMVDNESNKEFWEDDRTALLRPLDGTFIDAVRELLEDREKAKQLARNARELVLKKYTGERYAKATGEILLELLGEDRSVDVDIRVSDRVIVTVTPPEDCEVTIRINSLESTSAKLSHPIESISQTFEISVLKYDNEVFRQSLSLRDFEQINVVADDIEFSDALRLLSYLKRSGRKFSFVCPHSLPDVPNEVPFSPEFPTLRVTQYDRRLLHRLAGVGVHSDPPIFPRTGDANLVCVSFAKGIRHWDYPGGWDAIIKWLQENDLEVRVLNDLSISEKISLLSKCRFFLGEETDDMWLAYYCGVHSFLVVRETSLGYIFPDNRTLIHRRDNCYRCRWDAEECPVNHICMRALTPEEVAKPVADRFGLKDFPVQERTVSPEESPEYKSSRNLPITLLFSGRSMRVSYLKRDPNSTVLVRFLDDSGEIWHHETSGVGIRLDTEMVYDRIRKRRVQLFEDCKLVCDTDVPLEGRTIRFSFQRDSLGELLFWAPHLIEFSRRNHANIVVTSRYSSLLSHYNCGSVRFVNGGVFSCDLDLEIPYEMKPHVDRVEDLLGEWYGELKLEIPGSPKGYACVYMGDGLLKWAYPNGWKEVISYLSRRMKVVDLRSSESRIDCVRNASLYVGVGVDYSWLAYYCGVPVVEIQGPLPDYFGPQHVARASRDDVCRSCSGECAKGHQCTRYITPDMVISKIEEVLS